MPATAAPGPGACTGSSFVASQTNVGPFYFIVPGATETVTVTVTYTLADGSISQQVQQTQTFTVQGPTGNLLQAWMAPNNQAVQITNDSDGPSLSLTGSSYSGPDGGSLGMVFQANSGQAPSSGEWVWVQLISSSQVEELDSTGSFACPAQGQSQSGLDTSYPYAAGVSNRNDSPHLPMTGYGEYQRSLNATMYLMWDPQLPSSIPVPLESVSWGYSGCAINTLSPQSNGTTWTLQCGVAAPSTPQPSGYPEWTQLSPSEVTCSPN